MQNYQLGVTTKVFDNSSSCRSDYRAGHTRRDLRGEHEHRRHRRRQARAPAVKTYEQRYYTFGNQPNPDPNITTALFIYDYFPLLKLAIEKAGTAATPRPSTRRSTRSPTRASTATSP